MNPKMPVTVYVKKSPSNHPDAQKIGRDIAKKERHSKN